MVRHIELTTKNELIEKDLKDKYWIDLQPQVRHAAAARGSVYTTRFASINCPSDMLLLERVNALIAQKEHEGFSSVFLIGIGGSNLGTVAILQALHGQNYNDQLGKKFYCADTVDSLLLSELIDTFTCLLNSDQKPLLVIVSKSGTTTETVVNASIFLDILKKFDPEHYHKSIVAITDHDSQLWFTAKAENWSVLEIPMLVGGRYSVFSAVGLFPLGFLGVDISALLEGAAFMVERCLEENLEANPAAESAIFLYAQYQQNKNIHDTFFFSTRLEGIGKWYRQLMAESLGKKSESGQLSGIMPTVSLGSIDLHSMAQLYLGGPRDVMTTFVWVKNEGISVSIPATVLTNENSSQSYLAGKKLNDIMHAIFEGTQEAYKQDERPFITLSIPRISEQYIGAFLQMKMLEIMYLGYLMDVNPFDQPDVEKYKQVTRELLSQ